MTDSPSPIAAIHFTQHVEIDALLKRAVDQLIGDGIDVVGVLQGGDDDNEACAIDDLMLRGIRDDWAIKILEERGEHARGCRLNPRAIADAAGRLQSQLAEGADILVINRFGRAESEGHGLRNIFELAVECGIPVLTAVREDYIANWNEFHGGMAMELAGEPESILRWCAGIRTAA